MANVYDNEFVIKFQSEFKIKSELLELKFSETLVEFPWNFLSESNQKMFYFSIYVCL